MMFLLKIQRRIIQNEEVLFISKNGREENKKKDPSAFANRSFCVFRPAKVLFDTKEVCTAQGGRGDVTDIVARLL